MKRITIGIILSKYTTLEQFKGLVYRLVEGLTEEEFSKLKKQAKNVRKEQVNAKEN